MPSCFDHQARHWRWQATQSSEFLFVSRLQSKNLVTNSLVSTSGGSFGGGGGGLAEKLSGSATNRSHALKASASVVAPVAKSWRLLLEPGIFASVQM